MISKILLQEFHKKQYLNPFFLANNQITANDDKCHLILSCPEKNAAIQIEESIIKCSKVKKLIEIHIDYKLKFDTHVDSIFKKSHRKLCVLSRITNLWRFLKEAFL